MKILYLHCEVYRVNDYPWKNRIRYLIKKFLATGFIADRITPVFELCRFPNEKIIIILKSGCKDPWTLILKQTQKLSLSSSQLGRS
jgi:hypothetical protein